jgi:gliding motility-associated-like protein
MNGRYYLYSKKGDDGNTLINKCGLPMQEFDTIVVLVTDCPPPPPPPPVDPTLDDGLYGPEPDAKPLPVVIPNVLTSNSDNVNDLFKIENLNTWRTNKLRVYNRWGKVVYEKLNYKNDWDGGNVPAGVYYGTLEVKFESQYQIHTFNLTIIK